MVVLSFADSDLAGLAAAWALERDALPSVRLAHLRDLRHPMSVDLWIERVGAHAKVIVVRLLGGLDWWRYGIERLSVAGARARHRARGAARRGPRRSAARRRLDAVAGRARRAAALLPRRRPRESARACCARLAGHAGSALDCAPPQPVPRMAGYLLREGAVDLDRLMATLPPGRPVVPIVFYRSMLLAADIAPIDALCEALAARGLAPAPLFVTSLKDPDAAAFMTRRAGTARARRDRDHHRLRGRRQSGRADAARWAGRAGAAGRRSRPPSGRPGATARAASAPPTSPCTWCCRSSTAACSPAPIAFKHPLPADDGLAFTALANRPEPDRIAMVAERVAALVRLRTTPRARSGGSPS